MLYVCALMVASLVQPLYSKTFTLRSSQWNDHEVTVMLDCSLQKQEHLYKDFIKIYTDNPAISVESWNSSVQPVMVYDKKFKDSKSSYTSDTIFTIKLRAEEQVPFGLHVHYLLSTHNEPQQALFMIQPPLVVQEEIKEPKTVPTHTAQESSNFLYTVRDSVIGLLQKAKITISSLIQNSHSWPIRFGAVFLLGLLMSLTPCIYPMIPITVGVLQTSTGNTLFNNFLLALCYSLGMAFTFASLGFLAATGSAQFGLLLGNPIFVILLVLFLGYLAGSMLGMYEMYVPRFMQPRNHQVKGGSYMSAFVFGIMSGSVASPCLSPGLLLLLSIVATLGNKILGFLLLFMFGCGLGLPLLIIGTFSNSINLLPKAGLWMIEVKKLFGLMLLAMCYYYLSNIMPLSYVLIIMGVTLLGVAAYFVFSIQPYEGPWLRRYKYAMALLLCTISMVSIVKSFTSSEVASQEHRSWTISYSDAYNKAVEEQKLLFMDFGASWCSSCKEVAHTILHTPEVEQALTAAVPMYIDCTNPQEATCSLLQAQYKVIGFPTIVLVNPKNNTVVGRWGSELLDRTAQDFAHELQTLIK